MRRFIYLAMAVSGAIGFGNSHASAQVINGCIKGNGTLKIVADSTDCSSRETPISWNQVGPEGEPGLQGEPGEPGLDGLEGPPGPSLRMFDADGNVLGIPWFVPGQGANGGRVLIEELGVSMLVDALKTGIRNSQNLYFTEIGCQGQAYQETPSLWANHIVGPFHDITLASAPIAEFYVVQTGAVQTIDRVSRVAGSVCISTDPPVQEVALPADPFTGTLPFSFPPPTPFYVGIPPEASP